MANTPFTLAALATSAVPGLEVTGTRAHTLGSGGAFVSAVLATAGGEVIVRVPATAAAEVQQQGELLGQGALIPSARERLPFAVPMVLGMTRAGDTRAVVSTFLPGSPADNECLSSSSELLESVSEAIAAIHSLPMSIVQQGGLPMRTNADLRTLAARLMQRAAATGLLPETVHQRWREALASETLWGFESVVTHGSLAAEQLLVEGGRLVGVLGWNEFALGDPSYDLAWLMSAGDDTFETVLARYAASRDLAGVREFSARARLHHELEVAKWLLHGVETHDETIIDDAVAMLDHLVDRLGLLGAPLPTPEVLSEAEVEQLLETTPEVPFDQRSETAEFEALDEDRAFDIDHAAEQLADETPTSAKGDTEEAAEAANPAADTADADSPHSTRE